MVGTGGGIIGVQGGREWRISRRRKSISQIHDVSFCLFCCQHFFFQEKEKKKRGMITKTTTFFFLFSNLYIDFKLFGLELGLQSNFSITTTLRSKNPLFGSAKAVIGYERCTSADETERRLKMLCACLCMCTSVLL